MYEPKLKGDYMPRHDPSEKTKTEIIETTVRFVQEKGWEEVRVEDVVKEVGVTRGAFYHYFKSREELIAAVTDHFYREHNPFFLPYLLALGHSEAEIAEIWEQEMFRLVNEARVAHNLQPLVWHDTLGRSARTRANTPGVRNHIDPDGSTTTDVARRAGWQGQQVGEISAGSGGSPMDNVAGWLSSPTHRGWILGTSTHAGAGFGHVQDLTGFIEELHWSVDPLDRTVDGGPIATIHFSRR
jgi:AcrR family transcriptional regulator